MIVPVSADFSDLTSQTVYDSSDDNVLGTFVYSYAGHEVGRADVRMNDLSAGGYEFTERVSADTSETDDEAESDQQEAVSEEPVTEQPQPEGDTPKQQNSIHIEINVKTVAVVVGLLLAAVVLILLMYWLATHSYLIRQKIAGMRSRRSERNRYQTIHDTRKSRKRRRQARKSKHLRF